MEITPKTRLRDVLKECSAARDVLEKYNLNCMGCHGLAQDSLNHVIINNGLNPEEFLKELQDACGK